MVEARFIRRINRFAATVDLAGGETLVHVANSGRMRELLVTGRRVLLRPAAGDHRKTAFDLAMVDLGHALASADARLPNRLVHEALRDGRLPQFAEFDRVRPEVRYGESRLDLALCGPTGACYVETKSVTLVEGGAGLFPDAPTVRGRKHMVSLTRAVADGHRAAVVFRRPEGRRRHVLPQRRGRPRVRPHVAGVPGPGRRGLRLSLPRDGAGGRPDGPPRHEARLMPEDGGVLMETYRRLYRR